MDEGRSISTVGKYACLDYEPSDVNAIQNEYNHLYGES